MRAEDLAIDSQCAPLGEGRKDIDARAQFMLSKFSGTVTAQTASDSMNALRAEPPALGMLSGPDHLSMPYHSKFPLPHPHLSRRALLKRAGSGFGAMAFSALFGETSLAAVPKQPQFPAKARSVIFLFMEGAVSQVDSFDYKPLLAKYHGQDPRQAIGKLEQTQFNNVGKVMQSPWAFKQRGQSGMWISDLFPHVARHADDLCVINSMTSDFPEHTSANYFLHSGLGLQGRPSMGAWVAYGLGSENDNLPGFVVLNGGQIPSGGLDCFGSGFLPASNQGSLLNAKGSPLDNITPAEKLPTAPTRETSFRRATESAGACKCWRQ